MPIFGAVLGFIAGFFLAGLLITLLQALGVFLLIGILGAEIKFLIVAVTMVYAAWLGYKMLPI